MSSIGAQPLTRSIAAPVVRSGGIIAYLRAATFTAWMFSLVLYFWQIRTWEALIEALQEETTKDYFYYGFAICVLGHLTLGLQAWMAAPFQIISNWSGRLFTIFCGMALVLSPLSQQPKTSAIYAVATYGVYVLLYLYWRGDFPVAKRVAILTGIMLFAWMYLIWFKHGLSMGFGSSIGGLNRNTTGSTAVGAMILCLLSPNKKLHWVAGAACLLIILACDSRGSLAAGTIFFLTYYTLQNGTSRAALHFIAGLCVLGVSFLMVPALHDLLVDRVLKIHDAGRGIGSGFTGRSGLWAAAMSSFWRRPIFGYGFRTGGFGAHSGYIKLLVENGLVGFIPIIGSVVIEATRRFRLAMRLRATPPAAAPTIDIVESIRLNAIACGAILMMMCFWIYEQLYINLGAVICVVFFMMMVVPSYVAKQGAQTR
jgi:O-antigen ligase